MKEGQQEQKEEQIKKIKKEKKNETVLSEIIDCTFRISEFGRYSGEFGLLRDLKLRSAVVCPKQKQNKTKLHYEIFSRFLHQCQI